MRAPACQGGFTYFMLLWWVALSGVMLAAASQHWRFERQRDKEAEMVARATEIQAALQSYHRVALPGQPAGWPKSLAELVADQRGPHVVRHLRRVWTDPLTGRADWGLVMDEPVATTAPTHAPSAAPTTMSRLDHAREPAIRGVYSRATGQPIRPPLGVQRYADWRFEASPHPVAP